jgi:hypothetical protein
VDVLDWSCEDVASWMGSHGWVWRELDSYKKRLCEIGVTGRMLYDFEGLQRTASHATSNACQPRSCWVLTTNVLRCQLKDVLHASSESILEHDFRMHYRLHRKVFLDAVAKLQVRPTLTPVQHPSLRDPITHTTDL